MKSARRIRTLGGVHLRHEVEEGPDRWAPLVCDSGRGSRLSAAVAEGKGVAAGLLSSGPGKFLGHAGERREGRKESSRWGGEVTGPGLLGL